MKWVWVAIPVTDHEMHRSVIEGCIRELEKELPARSRLRRGVHVDDRERVAVDHNVCLEESALESSRRLA